MLTRQSQKMKSGGCAIRKDPPNVFFMSFFFLQEPETTVKEDGATRPEQEVGVKMAGKEAKEEALKPKAGLAPGGTEEERRKAASQQETSEMKLDVSGTARENISSTSRTLSDAKYTVGSGMGMKSGLVVKTAPQVQVSDSSDKTAAPKTQQKHTANLVPNAMQGKRDTPQTQHPTSEYPGKKSEPKLHRDKHVHWQKDAPGKTDKKEPGQRSLEIKVTGERVAPLAELEELSDTSAMWLMKDERQLKRKKSLDENDVNLAKSIRTSVEEKSSSVSTSSSSVLVKHSKQFSQTVTKISSTKGPLQEPDITTYSEQRSEKHEFEERRPETDQDNKENVETLPEKPKSETKDVKPAMTKTPEKDKKERRNIGGAVFGITGEKSRPAVEKLKPKGAKPSEPGKKQIVLPVIRPTDPRRWAIAVTDYSGTSQLGQPLESKGADRGVPERPKDPRRWGIAPRADNSARPPHEQYSQQFECEEREAPGGDAAPSSHTPLSATVATTLPHQSPLLSHTQQKPVLPRLLQPARKTSPGVVFYDDRASALSDSPEHHPQSPDSTGTSSPDARLPDDAPAQGAVGVSRYKRPEDTEGRPRDFDAEAGPAYVLYRRGPDGGQSVVVIPPIPDDADQMETIRSYSRRDQDTDSLLSEDIPRYVRKDQKQDMLAGRTGSKSLPLLAQHKASQESLHSLSEVRGDRGKKGFMLYMVSKPAQSETQSLAEEPEDTKLPAESWDDIEYYGPRRIETRSHDQLPDVVLDDVPDQPQHYQSVPNMDRYGEPKPARLRPTSAKSAPGDAQEPMPKFTYRPAYTQRELVEKTGHTFGIFGKKVGSGQSQKSKCQKSPKSPTSPKSPKAAVQRPKGPPPPVPPRTTPVKKPEVKNKSRSPQEVAQTEGHVFGVFGQQVPEGAGVSPSTVDETFPSASIKDIMSKLDLFEERGREMDKTEAGPAGHGQERVEVSLLRQEVVSQPGEPFSERQFVVGKRSPMGARLTRPVSMPEELIISHENQQEPELARRHSEHTRDRFSEPEMQERPMRDPMFIEQEDFEEEERVYSVKEIIQKINTESQPEMSTQKDKNKFEKCPYTKIARRYMEDSDKERRPTRYDDRRESPPHRSIGEPKIEKIGQVQELQMIYQNTTSIQEFDEEPQVPRQFQETSIEDDIKFMDDTDVTSIDSDTETEEVEEEMPATPTTVEGTRRLKPLGEKRVAQIHAIIDKKLGKKSGEEAIADEDITSYCLSKEKQKVLKKEKKRLPSYTDEDMGVQFPKMASREMMQMRQMEMRDAAGMKAEAGKPDELDGDESTPEQTEEESSSETESADSQMDTTEIPNDETVTVVKEPEDVTEEPTKVSQEESKQLTAEAESEQQHPHVHFGDDEEQKALNEEEERRQKEKEEREREEFLANEQRIRELEEKLARLEAPVREAVRKLLQVSRKTRLTSLYNCANVQCNMYI